MPVTEFFFWLWGQHFRDEGSGSLRTEFFFCGRTCHFGTHVPVSGGIWVVLKKQIFFFVARPVILGRRVLGLAESGSCPKAQIFF